MNAWCPKTPWDVMGCQNHLFGGPFRGVTFGGSGVSIGGVGSLRVQDFSQETQADQNKCLALSPPKKTKQDVNGSEV